MELDIFRCFVITVFLVLPNQTVLIVNTETTSASNSQEKDNDDIDQEKGIVEPLRPMSRFVLDTWPEDLHPTYDDDGTPIFHPNVTERMIKAFLLADISEDYPSSRPVRKDRTVVNVSIAISLYHILDTNEKYQTLTSLISVRVRWINEYLRWKSPTVKKLWIPAVQLWLPDLVFKNNAEESMMSSYSLVNTLITGSGMAEAPGTVLWMFPVLLKSQCSFHVDMFPFDAQMCTVHVISWTYSAAKLDLRPSESDANAILYNPDNQEWYADRITVTRNVTKYECCQTRFPEVIFTIHLRRRSLFYVFNLLFPCLLFYALSFLAFFLPVESGDKVNLEITVLLSLVVFLMIVAETLPPTPESLPILGVLVCVTMVMASVALVFTVITTNVYHLHPKRDPLSPFLRSVLIRFGKYQGVKSMMTESCFIPTPVIMPLRVENDQRQIKRMSQNYDETDLMADAAADTCLLNDLDTDQKPAQHGNHAPNCDFFQGHVNSSFHCGSPVFDHSCSRSPRAKTGKAIDKRRVTVVARNDDDDESSSGASDDSSRVDTNPWHEISRLLDRLFFWIFFAISCVAFAYLGWRSFSSAIARQREIDTVKETHDSGDVVESEPGDRLREYD